MHHRVDFIIRSRCYFLVHFYPNSLVHSFILTLLIIYFVPLLFYSNSLVQSLFLFPRLLNSKITKIELQDRGLGLRVWAIV